MCRACRNRYGLTSLPLGPADHVESEFGDEQVGKGGKLIQITIPGEPIAKNRPRFARRGKFVKTYSDQQTEEGKWMYFAQQQIAGPLITEPLSVDLVFFIKRPRSHYGTGRNASTLKPSAPKWPENSKDTDNYIKFALDCLNNVLYDDDHRVIRVMGIKQYSDYPRTEIVAMRMDEILEAA